MHGMADTGVHFVTLGCRLNAYETEVMRQHAHSAGANDTVVVNTCAVTHEAKRKSRQTVRRLRREHPDARLVVTGCAAQIDPRAFAGIRGVDVVLGNSHKLNIDSWHALVRHQSPPGDETVIMVDDIMIPSQPANHVFPAFETQRVAYVQVQTGCDHRCTFCVIPYGRGNSTSLSAGAIVDRIRMLAEQGYREVVLTGVDMTSWGADLPRRPQLGDLVDRILKQVPNLPRLRLSSIDPAEVDDALVRVMADEERLMPHLHLSLQSGDDMILKRMKRRHLRSDVIMFCESLRELRPDIVFGADLIAGFPTETDAMHEQTVDLVRECAITWLHVFPYSPHDETPAARMPQVNGAIIRQRAAHLRHVALEQRLALFDQMQGRDVEVLMENDVFGRAGNYAEIKLKAKARYPLVRVRVTGFNQDHLIGTPAASGRGPDRQRYQASKQS